MLEKIYKIIAVSLFGFAGGSISPWTLGWIKSIKVAEESNAISIANTYIVFTTIIFVGITVVLAIVGYVLHSSLPQQKKTN